MRDAAVVVVLALVLAVLPVAAQDGATGGDPQGFLDGFAQAVEAHRWDDVVSRFSADHVSSQRDGMLSGRTGQFLVEALGLAPSCSGYTRSEKKAFSCLKRVGAVRLVGPAPGSVEELPVTVHFAVEPRRKAAPVTVELLLVQAASHGGHGLGLEGAVG